MQNWIKSAAIAAVAVTLTSVFFIDFCSFVYQCGCTHLWAGADAHCNIHHAGTKHCPWCSSGVAGSYSIYAAIVLPQAALAFRPKRWTARRRLAASALAFPVIGSMMAGILGVATGYWN